MLAHVVPSPYSNWLENNLFTVATHWNTFQPLMSICYVPRSLTVSYVTPCVSHTSHMLYYYVHIGGQRLTCSHQLYQPVVMITHLLYEDNTSMLLHMYCTCMYSHNLYIYCCTE